MIENIILSKHNNIFTVEYNNQYSSVDEILFYSIDAIQKYKTIEEGVKHKHKISSFFNTSELHIYEPIIIKKINEIFKVNDRKDYIFFKFKIIPNGFIELYSSFFSFLFNKLLFFTSLLLMFGLNIYFYLQYDFKLNSLTNIETIYYSIIILVLLLFHELGHATSAYLYTKRAKHIGFGFYQRILPVFFADVSHSWHLDRIERVIISLAGIYMQLFLNTFIIIGLFLKLIPHNSIIDQVLQMNLIIAVYSLTPFLRNDGYWVISDLININNLHEKGIVYLPKVIYKKEKINYYVLLFSVLNFFFNILIFYGIWKFSLYFLQKYFANPFVVINSTNIGQTVYDVVILLLSIYIVYSKISVYITKLKLLKK